MRSVQVDDIKINYKLTYKDVKNINLRIKPNSEILVSANKNIEVNNIDDFLLAKARFILKSLEKFHINQKHISQPKQYISGESFKILGKDLRLRVLFGESETIYNDGVYLFLTTKNKDDLNRKRTMINDWVNNQRFLVFNEVVAKVYKKVKKYNTPFPQIKIRKMKSRWGSCQPNKEIITLNSQLIEAPRFCIEYVALHELCHFIHPNHSKTFYNFLTMMMPDWKERKNILEKNYLSNLSDE